jgi:LacI family transcriptional regulator
VDRALNNRGDVNPEVADRIRRVADELGYAPHRAAKALRLNHSPQSIAVLLPRTSSDFFAEIQAGVLEGEREFVDMGIHTEILWFDPQDEDGFARTVTQVCGAGYAGLVLTGPQTEAAAAAVRDAVTRGLPVVTTNSDLPDTNRLAFVGQDLVKSGEVAAELVAKLVRRRTTGPGDATALTPGGRIVALTGSMHFQAHRDRIEGFRAGLARWASDLTVEVLEGHDQYETSRRVLAGVSGNGIAGAYAATGSIRALLEARRTWEQPDGISVVTNDDLPVVREGLASGEIDFTILQDARKQGSEPVRIVAEYLLTGTRPEVEWVRTPVVIAGASLLAQ